MEAEAAKLRKQEEKYRGELEEVRHDVLVTSDKSTLKYYVADIGMIISHS